MNQWHRYGHSRLVQLHRGVDLYDCMRSVQNQGVHRCVPIPLIRGFRCLCDPAGDRILAAHPAVSRVEDDIEVTLAASSFGLRHAQVTPGVLPDGIRAIRARSAWSISQGEGVGVAIFDTGVDLFHPDLAANVAGGINLVTPGTPPQDDNGHGTHVAGIVAAVGSTTSVIGVAPRARLFAIKVLDDKGDGRLSDVILGLQWIVDQKIPVANMSLDIRNNSEALETAVRNAVASGVTIVAATGNLGKPNSVTYPAAYREVIAVSAVSCDGKPTAFTSTGPEVDLAAPGVGVLSTALNRRYG